MQKQQGSSWPPGAERKPYEDSIGGRAQGGAEQREPPALFSEPWGPAASRFDTTLRRARLVENESCGMPPCAFESGQKDGRFSADRVAPPLRLVQQRVHVGRRPAFPATLGTSLLTKHTEGPNYERATSSAIPRKGTAAERRRNGSPGGGKPAGRRERRIGRGKVPPGFKQIKAFFRLLGHPFWYGTCTITGAGLEESRRLRDRSGPVVRPSPSKG